MVQENAVGIQILPMVNTIAEAHENANTVMGKDGTTIRMVVAL